MAITTEDITGNIGDLNFYKRDGVTIIRLKEGISRHRIKKSPEMINNRKNTREFGACSNTASIIYTGFHKLLIGIELNYKKSKNNLVRLLRQIQQDFTSEILGKRSVPIFGFLTNFNFSTAIFDNTATMAMVVMYDINGVNVRIPSFNPNLKINKPAGADYYRLDFAIIEIPRTEYNETEKQYNKAKLTSKETIYGIFQELLPPVTVEEHNFLYTCGGGCNVILTVGISFYTESGGVYTNMYNGNASKILQVINF